MAQVPQAPRSLRAATKLLLAAIIVYIASMFVYRLFNGMAFDPAASGYVSIDPSDREKFLKDLSAIANSHGLRTWISSAVPDDGPALYVVEGSGRALNLWAQNVLLSGQECGRSGSPQNDPGQFRIHVLPSMWLPIRSRATALFESVSRDLSAKGYRLAQGPSIECGSTPSPNGLPVPPNKSLERTREGQSAKLKLRRARRSAQPLADMRSGLRRGLTCLIPVATVINTHHV
jgi:hypothetical protein